ncbi:MAG: hypothetical protein JSV80_03095 [Acidobacteriota bacterium]|nr:MAG: hypothetical protein JSV80_03095 [Acidobacteriota bacterium]
MTRWSRWGLTLSVVLSFVPSSTFGQPFCPGAGRACSSESVCTRSDVLFCEDWEDGNRIGWDFDSEWTCGAPDHETCIVDVGGHASRNALRLTILENQESTAYPGVPLTYDGSATLYVRWYAKFSPDYVFMPNYSDGQKHLYFLGSGGTINRFFIQAPSWSERDRAQITNSLGSHENVRFYNGTAEQFIFADRWYCIEAMVQPNSAAGVADGRIAVWLDDEPYMDHSNLTTRNCSTCDWDVVPWVTTHYGGNPGPDHPQQYVYYDNFVVSTSRIGCVSAEPFCGNGIIDPGEQCDGNDIGNATCESEGFYCGRVACNSYCELIWTGCVAGRCGDLQIQAQCGEECDGTNLGGETCESRGFEDGVLSCTPDCEFDSLACTGPSSFDCDNPSPDWQICENFEDGNFNDWDDVDDDNGDLRVALGEPSRLGDFGAVQDHHLGDSSGWASKWFGDHPLMPGGPGAMENDVYVNAFIRLDPDTTIASNGSQWLLVLGAFEDWSSTYPSPMSWSPYYLTLSANENFEVQTTLANRTSGTSEDMTLEQNDGLPVSLVPGMWHELQLHVSLNSPGQADGIIEVWIDNVRKARYDDVDVRGLYTRYGLNFVMLNASAWPSAPAEQSQYWDDIIVSTTYVDPALNLSSFPPSPRSVDRTDVQ